MRTSHGHRAGWCIHYRSDPRARSADQTCHAGVRYVDFNGGKIDAMYKAMPCFLDKKTHRPTNADAKPCEHLRPPTLDEIATHEEWFRAHMNKMIIVMTATASFRQKHKGKSAQEVVECPACKGRLHLSIAASNGHVHGKCETPDCVSWME